MACKKPLRCNQYLEVRPPNYKELISNLRSMMDNTIPEDMAEVILAAVNWNVEQAFETIFS